MEPQTLAILTLGGLILSYEVLCFIVEKFKHCKRRKQNGVIVLKLPSEQNLFGINKKRD